jgi:hypothetical protein
MTIAFVVGSLSCTVLCLGIFLTRYKLANGWAFQAQTSQSLGGDAMATIVVDTKLSIKPLFGGFSIQAKTTPPYDLDVGLYTQTASSALRTAILEQVTIQYADGQTTEVVKPENKLVWTFTTRRLSNWDGQKIVYHESLATGGTLTNCICKNVPFGLVLRGTLVKNGGTYNPFTLHWNFVPRRLRGIIPNYSLDREVASSDLPRP